MLGLPKSTEIRKPLFKKDFYQKFKLNSNTKNKFDEDVSTMNLLNYISPDTTNIFEGENIKSFYLLYVNLKKKDYSDTTITLLLKLIPQNLIVVLGYKNEVKLAVYYTKVIEGNWKDEKNSEIILNGVNLDIVWENIIKQIYNLNLESKKSLEIQIQEKELKLSLNKQIDTLEKKARKEIQPRKKFDIVKEVNSLKKQLEKLENE